MEKAIQLPLLAVNISLVENKEHVTRNIEQYNLKILLDAQTSSYQIHEILAHLLSLKYRNANDDFLQYISPPWFLIPSFNTSYMLRSNYCYGYLINNIHAWLKQKQHCVFKSQALQDSNTKTSKIPCACNNSRTFTNQNLPRDTLVITIGFAVSTALKYPYF